MVSIELNKNRYSRVGPKNGAHVILQNALTGAFAGGLAGAFEGANMYKAASQANEMQKFADNFDQQLDGSDDSFTFGKKRVQDACQDPNSGSWWKVHDNVYEGANCVANPDITPPAVDPSPTPSASPSWWLTPMWK